uniref:protein C2-DOMAIN ABA-RELATED 10-like n=1 Tax=Erigeron canadensis TaxID=72917 RepID=UPI001CB8F1CB|nr:protein C2-DOMAIN ABA-RELATED 10-like [Erigeron canadensis]
MDSGALLIRRGPEGGLYLWAKKAMVWQFFGLLRSFGLLASGGLAVYDKDKFSNDDSMGMTEIDIKPYIECLRMGINLNNLSDGTKLDRVHPRKHNYLADESCIIWENGKIVQDMILRLKNVECGEVAIQIELVPLPGRRIHV